MGASHSTGTPSAGAAPGSLDAAPGRNAYALAMEYVKQRAERTTGGGATPGVTGGDCGCVGGYFGGAEGKDPMVELREYESSLAAKAKENTIRGIARALKRAGVSVDPDADFDVIVKAIIGQLPNPKHGKTFPEDAKKQEKICDTIVDVLNDEFSPGASKPADKFIDKSLSAAEKCRAVAEWVHSFAGGVHKEFLEVHAAVKNAERNIEVMEKVMDELYGKITDRVASDGGEVARDVAPWDEIYRRAKRERQLQHEKLKNFLNVTLAPAQKELEIAMRDESEANALIKRIGLKPGTAEFADSLAMAVSGLGTVAAVAARVHKALRQVGLSVREYLDSKDFKDLESSLDRKLMSGGVKTEDVAKFLDAVRTLRTNFQKRTELATALAEEKRPAAESTTGAGVYGGAPAAPAGGDADDEKGSTIDKRIKKKEAERKLIIRDFTEKIARHYDEIIAAIKAITPKLGKEIPLSDKLDELKDALLRMEGMREKRNELALIGVYADATAREQRGTFISTIRMVLDAVRAVMELEMYRGASSVFARLRAGLEDLEKTVNFYFDVMQQKYGGDMSDATPEEVYGGASELPAEVARSTLNFKEAIQDLAYGYYIAKVRQNLNQTKLELDEYGTKYADVLGDAVSARLRTLAADRKTKEAELEDKTPGTLGAPAQHAAIDVIPGISDAKKAERKTGVDAMTAERKNFIKREYETKEKFYRALQALDLYMKVFTQAIVADPDAVRDIKRILDGTQTIVRWFSDQAGESLASAFDYMTQFNIAAGIIIPIDAANKDETVSETKNGPRAGAPAGSDHYYAKLAAAMTAGGIGPGIPQASINLSGTIFDKPEADARIERVNDVREKLGSFFENFQALKNLVTAFASIGDKFGGKEIRKQVFMSPTQIYKALVEYLRESALSLGFEAKTPPLTLLGQQVAGTAPAAEVYFGSVDAGAGGKYAGAGGNYRLEDQYFTFMIKAMAAKVLTVVGVFDLFERPGPVINLTPVRMIIGGADDSTEIIDSAAELYFRLPRLAEFYRSLFYWDGAAGSLRISMIPEMDDVFSGLIRLIFQRSGAEQGDYSDVEIRMLIREVNAIHSRFHEKSPEKTTQSAIAEFVKEINRRYGVVKRDDMKKYWDDVRRGRESTSTSYPSLGQTNYSILPGEDDDEPERRLAPSDRFAVGDPVKVEFGGKYTLDTKETDFKRPPEDLYASPPGTTDSKFALVWSLRRRLDDLFHKELKKNSSAQGLPSVSFSSLIRQAQEEMKKTQSHDTKFTIVSKLIQGTSIAAVDVGKAFMFHETVMTGLNVLSGIYTLLTEFNARLVTMDVKKIEDAIIAGLASGNTQAGAALAQNNFNGAAVAAWVAARAGIAAADSGRYIVPDGFNLSAQGRGWISAGGAVDTAALYQGCLRAGAGAAGDRRAQKLFAHLVVNYQAIMVDLLENLFGMTSSFQGLVELRFPNTDATQIHLDFSKLRSVVEDLLGSVKHYLDVFRPSLPKEVIARFEDQQKPGSVFWLEKNLIDGLIRGVPGAAPGTKNTLEDISRRANGIFMHLTRKLDLSAVNATAATLVSASPFATQADKTAYADAFVDENATEALTDLPAAAALPNTYIGWGLRSGIPADEVEREYFGSAISRILFYDNLGAVAAGDPDAVAAGNEVTGAAGDANLRINVLIRSNSTREAADAKVRTLADVKRLTLFENAPGLTDARSLLFAFNQLVAKYIMTFYDAPSTRIYLNLINSFANGTFSQSVVEPVGKAFPDIEAGGGAGINFGLRGDPKPGALLLQSLAFALQRLTKDVNPNTQATDHLTASLIDVPMYLKESFRANLPYYVKFLDMVIKKGEFIKVLLQRTRIKVGRANQTAAGRTGAAAGTVVRSITAGAAASDRNAAGATAAAAALAAAIAGGVAATIAAATTAAAAAGVGYIGTGASLNALEALDGEYKDSTTMRAKFTAIIDNIVSGATTLSTSATEVLRELGDQGVYLETGEGFIATYKSRYGRLPLMPASLLLTYLQNLNPAARDISLFPEHTQGTELFKLAYGSRQILGKRAPVTLDMMPGAKAILETYNGVTPKREQLPVDKFQAFTQRIVDGLRFIADTRNFAGTLTPSVETFTRSSIVAVYGAAAPSIGIRTGDGGNAVFSVAETRQATIEIVEGISQEDQIASISQRVGSVASASKRDRSSEWILNLIDLNIIPINVHALMRDVPLVNTYNYSYTFEQLAASMFGQVVSDIEGRDIALDNPVDAKAIRDTKQMFVKLLIDPYAPIPARVYGSDSHDIGTTGLIHRMFRGDTSTGLGRPKFLSDQLFNKSLFGSTYTHSTDYDEAGPGVGAGVSRGPETPARYAVERAYGVQNIIGATNATPGTLWAAMEMARAADTTGQAFIAAFPTAIAGTMPAVILAQSASDLGTVVNLLGRLAVTANTTAVRNELNALIAQAPVSARGIRNILEIQALVAAPPVPAIANLPSAADMTAADSAAAGITDAFGRTIMLAADGRAAIAAATAALTLAGMASAANVAHTIARAARLIGAQIDDFATRLVALIAGGGVGNNARRLVAFAVQENGLPSAQRMDVKRNTWAQRSPTDPRATHLTYLQRNAGEDTKVINSQIIGADDAARAQSKRRLEEIGRARFDTRLVRNIFFIVNVLRVMRLKLNRELTQIHSVVVSSHTAVSPSITEYDAGPYGPNEVDGDQTY